MSKPTKNAACALPRMSDEDARSYLERLRWPNGPICAHCGSTHVTRLQGQAHRPGVIQCNECHGQFTVTVGTILEDSHISLSQWVLAFHLMCSSKKGVSALQLQRNLGLGSYRSAWHLAHRIRHAMERGGLLMSGTVEVDETYIGGKTKGGKRGRGSDKKTPVVLMVERGGRAFSRPVSRVNAKELKKAIREHVLATARICTDEWGAYNGLEREFSGGHAVVNHGSGEYVRGDVYTNTAESYFALLKRGIHGIFHQVSKWHLFRYCSEFSFRWSFRKVNDLERMEEAIRGMVGKRLMYAKLVPMRAVEGSYAD